ncbi:hypothetical protein BC628DRAFT_854446 [Trametes gibbosa]|nr:hypothetical protein BC628DRAFT_854446 [Trametes gibbosa]
MQQHPNALDMTDELDCPAPCLAAQAQEAGLAPSRPGPALSAWCIAQAPVPGCQPTVAVTQRPPYQYWCLRCMIPSPPWWYALDDSTRAPSPQASPTHRVHVRVSPPHTLQLDLSGEPSCYLAVN